VPLANIEIEKVRKRINLQPVSDPERLREVEAGLPGEEI
jgi:hypothetical protein